VKLDPIQNAIVATFAGMFSILSAYALVQGRSISSGLPVELFHMRDERMLDRFGDDRLSIVSLSRLAFKQR
jgi:hypothetical protein